MIDQPRNWFKMLVERTRDDIRVDLEALEIPEAAWSDVDLPSRFWQPPDEMSLIRNEVCDICELAGTFRRRRKTVVCREGRMYDRIDGQCRVCGNLRRWLFEIRPVEHEPAASDSI